MKFDFSYIELVYNIIDGKEDISRLRAHEVYKDIKSHAESSYNDYSRLERSLQSILDGKSDKYAQYILEKREEIFNVVNIFKAKEEEIIDIIISNVRNIYKEASFTDITIFFSLGYDIGIGINNHVISSIEFQHIFDNYKELVSILIHEITHVIIYKYFPESKKYNLKYKDIKKALNFFIQNEGIAIFSAYNYRKENNLKSTGFITNTDYENTKEKEVKVRQAYKDTMKYIDEGKEEDIIFDTYFNARVDHSLGFSIFHNEYKKNGYGKIRGMAVMDNDEFAKRFLII